jgi:hypothetical protein
VVTDSVSGKPGVRLEFLGPDRTGAGQPAGGHRYTTALTWWGGLTPGVGWGEPGIIRLCTAAALGGRDALNGAARGLLSGPLPASSP